MTWPFENDTRKVERNFAKQNFAANKQRNLLISIIILAASLLLTFSAILICNATIDTQVIVHVNNRDEMVNVIFGIAVVLLFTAGISIKNIMYISVLQRTRQFAQLRTIGATYRQIKAVIHNERKQLSWKFILSGLLLGILCNLVLPLQFYWLPSIFCALFVGGFVWFIVFLSFCTPAKLAASLSPVAALNAYSISDSEPVKRNIHITPHNLAKKYFSSNRKKAVYTLLSLTLSGVIMFVVFSVISAVDIKELVQQQYYENSSIYLMLNSTADEDSTYNLMKNSPFTESLKENIKNISGITEIYSLKTLDCEIFISNIPENSNIELALNSIVDTTSFETSLVEGKMPYSQKVVDTIPVVVNRLSPYYKESGFNLKLGGILSASVNTGKSIRKVKFSVCGFIENKDNGCVLYSSPEYLDHLAEMNCDLAWYICTEDSKMELAVKQMKELVSSDNRMTVCVFAEDLDDYNTIFYNTKVAVAAVTMLVCLFAFINLLNTCITNTIMRCHDYALLEAAGMTKTQIQQTQGEENRFYFLNSLLGSCIIGLPLGFFLCIKIAQIPGLSYVSYKFPWAFVLFYIIFVSVVHAMVTVYQRHILSKSSIIERIGMNE